MRNLIGERAETAADTGDSVFQPTREDPAVVVIIDEIDETGKIEGASKILEFLASKQRKAAVILILAGQRATATWTGGAGVRINLSTVVTGMLARDSESRHAVGAENEIPDIAEYCGGEAGFFQIWSTRAKKILARGRSFYIGSIGEQQEHIISRRDPAARPVLEGAAEAAAPAPAAPRDQPGSALRERLAHVRELNEGRPLPARTGRPPGAPGGPRRACRSRGSGCSGCSPRGAPGLGGRAGPGHVEVGRPPSTCPRCATTGWRRRPGAGAGPDGGWHRPEPRPPAGAGTAPYTTIASLAQAVHDGRVAAGPTSSGRSWSRSGRSPTGRA